MKANPGTPEQVRRGPGDITLAALLALSALIERARAPRGAWIAAVPIIIVNYAAFRAQLRFWQAHLDPVDAFLVSAALESIAVYWSWLAAQALIADDSALRPRLAAYGTALLIGTLNYSHYCRPGWRPTVAAVTFGMMSAISPWLWSAYSRRVSRPLLKAKNLIEDHSVRLGVTRWFWHAWRCTGVMRLATWEGENRPAEAIALYESRRAAKHDGRDKTSGGPAQSRYDSHGWHGGPAGKRGTVVPPAGNPLAGEAPPPPARPRREPRRAVNDQREARDIGTGRAAAAPSLEQAVLAELLAHPEQELPGYRELSRDRFGMERSRVAARVLEQARRARNGGSHDDDQH